jgi:hypothetical protein
MDTNWTYPSRDKALEIADAIGDVTGRSLVEVPTETVQDEEHTAIDVGLLFFVGVEAEGDSAQALQDRTGTAALPETWMFAVDGTWRAIYALPAGVDPSMLGSERTAGTLDGTPLVLLNMTYVRLPYLYKDDGDLNPCWRTDPLDTEIAEAPAWVIDQLRGGAVGARGCQSHPDR